MRKMAELIKRGQSLVSAYNKAGNPLKKTSMAKLIYNRSTVKQDVLLKGVSGISKAAGWAGGYTKVATGMITASRPYQKAQSTLSKGVLATRAGWSRIPSKPKRIVGNIAKTVGTAGLLGVGAVGMLSVGIMNGINNGAKDIVLDRYLADQRYARDMLSQTRIGTSMGTSRMSQLGSTIGLSNSLSKTRHGARY